MPIKNIDHITIVSQDMAGTLHFYCDVLGLINKVSPDDPHTVYLHSDIHSPSLIHLMDAAFPSRTAEFQRLAVASPLHNTEFRGGPLDHVCFLMQGSSYESVIKQLKNHAIEFQSHEHSNRSLKQIWILDPNGIRIELNFN